MTALTELDLQVLDLIFDDYYALWEVCDFIAQLMGHQNEIDSKALVSKYVLYGYADVFVQDRTGMAFQKVPTAEAQHLLDEQSSWKKGSDRTIAITVTKKAEDLLIAK